MNKKDTAILGIFLVSLFAFGIYFGYMLNQFINYEIPAIEVLKEFWGIIPLVIFAFLCGWIKGESR